jgi:hypothetical protein
MYVTHRKLLYFLIFLCFICSCTRRYQRSPAPGFGFSPIRKNIKTNPDEEAFAMATIFGTSDEIEVFLKAGHDPNRMNFLGAIPWHDTNPLWLITTCYEKAQLFIKHGADLTRRPYIASIFTNQIVSERFPDVSFFEYAGTKYESEVYNLVKLFLDAGADPNFKGSGGPPVLLIATDWNYKRYFKKNGRLPINYAIEANAFTIVDVLLEYGSTLDETSLKSAEIASAAVNDTAMLDYIRAKMKEKGLL